ncbi:MAG: hypothetical protein HYU88_02850, partial [Chloroflexi bacterium]|nr:hypothetical protein [Chloroflexota bacterium]
AEAVHALLGQPLAVKQSVSVDLPLAAHLPASYVADPAQRLNLYQRLADAATAEEVGTLGAELCDRFGPPPQPALNLLYVVELKVLAQQAGVEAISRRDGAIVLVVSTALPAEVLRAACAPAGQAATVRPGVLRLDQARLRDWQPVLYEVVRRLGDGRKGGAEARVSSASTSRVATRKRA